MIGSGKVKIMNSNRLQNIDVIMVCTSGDGDGFSLYLKLILTILQSCPADHWRLAYSYIIKLSIFAANKGTL